MKKFQLEKTKLGSNLTKPEHRYLDTLPLTITGRRSAATLKRDNSKIVTKFSPSKREIINRFYQFLSKKY